jgi:hypothetical protein
LLQITPPALFSNQDFFFYAPLALHDVESGAEQGRTRPLATMLATTLSERILWEERLIRIERGGVVQLEGALQSSPSVCLSS